MRSRTESFYLWTSRLMCWAIFTLALQILLVPLLIAPLAAAGVSCGLIRKHGNVGHVAIATSTLFALVLFEGGARIAHSSTRQFSRPHELLTSEHQRYYEPGRRIVDFEIPYGDLFPLSRRSLPTIVVPRRVSFETDELGFRNRTAYTAYRGQPFILVGDSFGVGAGSSQEDIVSEVLSRDHGIPVYNASWPSDPAKYVETFRFVRESVEGDPLGIFMIFEGNDFPCPREKLLFDVHRRWYAYVLKSVRRLQAFRNVAGLFRRGLDSLGVTKPGEVSVWSIADQDVGFYDRYRVVAERPSLDGCSVEEEFSDFAEIREFISLLVFVPTKFRVYHALLSDPGDSALPNMQAEFLEDLAGQLGVPYLDLTSSLERESRLLLEEGRYTFWRDDSHWSPEGMRVGAQEIAKALQPDHRTEERKPSVR